MWVRRAAHVKKNVQSCFEIHFSKRLFYAQKQGIAVSAFPFLILSIRALIEKESCFAGFSACGGSHKRHLPLRRSAILAESFNFIGKQFSMKLKNPCFRQDVFETYRKKFPNTPARNRDFTFIVMRSEILRWYPPFLLRNPKLPLSMRISL